MSITPPEHDAPSGARQEDVVIIGMACLFPGAPDLDTYWHNIITGVDAVTDATPDRWDTGIFFDPDSSSPGRVYCKRGGYLGDLARCNPLEYGLMPVVVSSGSPDEVLSLRVAHQALADAGYATRPFNRERTEVVFGRGNYSTPAYQNVAQHTLGVEGAVRVVQSLHPEYSPEELEMLRQELRASLPRFAPDTAASAVPNLTTGRVANRLDLMGPNFTIDAACASALIAMDLAVRDLQGGRCDLALVGGVHLTTDLPVLAVFSQLGAMSRASQIRPFDERADGIVPGEGLGVMVLKRRRDAERDGDRIYAVIRGVGTSSDGRGQGPLAPRVEGEEMAIRRAYAAAGVAPETVELIEAHGTGTPVGDLAEMQALARVFGARRGPLPTCAIGSVKSMIGHLMPAAGIAGLIKAALAVHHRVLPPTLHCERPHPQFGLEKTPFYINSETRPWVHGDDAPRRAGVNAFGFGGINAHVILEEAPAASPAAEPPGAVLRETEVCVVQGATRPELLAEIRRLVQRLELGGTPEIRLKDLAYSLNSRLRPGTARLSLVASSVGDLRGKLARALQRLEDPACRQLKDPSGVYFFEEPLLAQGKLVFLFPGETSQYPDMLKDLCVHIPGVRAEFDFLDRVFAEQPLRPSHSIFPVAGVSDDERASAERRLWEMGGALDAILTANAALHALLLRLEIRPDMILGHSMGELSALAAAGVVTPDPVLLGRLAEVIVTYERMGAEDKLPEAAVAAVGADRASVLPLLERFHGAACVAMDNCPHQVVIVGDERAVEGVLEELQARGTICQRLPFTRAYHTPAFSSATQPLDDLLREVALAPPRTEIFCAATAAPYPRDPREIHRLMVELWSRPVEFVKTVEALFEAGARVFVEVGARGNLTAFVDDILRGRPHLAIPCDVPRRSGILQLNHVVGLLVAQGATIRFDALYEGRAPRLVSLEPAGETNGKVPHPSPELPVPLAYPMLRLAARPGPVAPARPAPGPSASPRAEPAGAPGMPLPAALTAPGGLELVSRAVAPPVPGEAVLAGTAPASAVMSEHLRTMEQFLNVEQEVMEAFFGISPDASAGEAVQTHASPGASPLALQGTIVSMTPGREVIVRRRMDAAEDRFLDDHALGSQVSDVDPTLKPLPVVPFTVCLEMMTEVAALLAPGQVPTGIRQGQARQWIEVATPVTVEISARRAEGGIRVEVRNLGGDEGTAKGAPPVVAEATVIFGHAYPEPPPPPPLSLRAERPPRYTAAEMYRERLMFHGPCFQGVVALDRVAENGVVGHLKVLPRTGLFASSPQPPFLLDPALLDATGQLIGYWAAEYLASGYIVFPIRLATLEVYGECPGEGEVLRCEVEIHEVSTRRLRASMTLVGADGRMWARLSDWEDWRFYWPRELYDHHRAPKRCLATQAWEPPVSGWPVGPGLAAQRLDAGPEITGTIAARLFVFAYLSGAERREWAALAGPEKRRTEWVLGRAAAKDAVRRLLKARYDVDVFPADIEIGHDEDGRPLVRAAHLGGSIEYPAVSVSHSEAWVVALAGYTGRNLGIDLEPIRPREESFLRIAFDERELAPLAPLASPERDAWITRLWCAKEAVAKAVGTGLVGGPRAVTVTAIDLSTGTVEIALGPGLTGRVPELAGAAILARTGRQGDHAVAVCLGESRP